MRERGSREEGVRMVGKGVSDAETCLEESLLAGGRAGSVAGVEQNVTVGVAWGALW